MAEFGAKHPCFKPDNENSGVVLGKLVAANLTVNLASGELYADDALDEQASEFASGSIAMETNDLTDANASKVYGCSVTDNTVIFNKGDTPPTGKLAYYKSLMRNKVKYFKGIYYPKVRAALGNDNAQTKGSSITFATAQTTFTVFEDENGDWRHTKTFDNENAAKAWVEEKCSVAVQHEINVSVQGAEGTEKAEPRGIRYVANAGSFTLTISGTPTKLYDNGVDKTSDISAGVYTLANVTAAHTIAVIF